MRWALEIFASTTMRLLSSFSTERGGARRTLFGLGFMLIVLLLNTRNASSVAFVEILDGINRASIQ